MTRAPRAFRRHAESLVERELERLAALPSAEREAVADVATRVTSAVVDGILEHARADSRLAASLVSIYGGAD
jgi:hypothetical protein